MTLVMVSLEERQLVEIQYPQFCATSEGGSEKSTKIARYVSRHPLQIYIFE